MDILNEIIERRKQDISRLGFSYACDVPKARGVGVRKFLGQRGAILEVKRASPSKGDIAPNLDAPKTALEYAKAGARAISVLTEKNYFKGSLNDLMAVRAALDEYAAKTGNEAPAVLRKDFLTDIEDIEVAFRAGADAVLLIARILENEQFAAMAKKVQELGMSALIEVREDEDIEKLRYVFERVNPDNFVCGVNSRDLKDFSIDMLVPAKMFSSIKKIVPNGRLIFESGILSPECAAFVSSMGFDGFLMGEAAAKNPARAAEYIKAFENNAKNPQGKFWLDYAKETLKQVQGDKSVHADNADSHAELVSASHKPLVKICGLTQIQDALLAAELGADFLGFIFCAASPRNTNAELVKSVRAELQDASAKRGMTGFKMPKMVAVITELESDEGKAALQLARQKIVDAIQFHGFEPPAFVQSEYADIPRYAAVNITNAHDIEKLKLLVKSGQPRVLIDSRSGDAVGGTGKTIDKELTLECKKELKLWLAGGITAQNVRQIVADFEPELIDIATGVESAPGVKDKNKLRALFEALK